MRLQSCSHLVVDSVGIIYLFIYLKSTTKGPEGHVYCRRYTNVQKENTKIIQSSIQSKQKDMKASSIKCTAQTMTDVF